MADLNIWNAVVAVHGDDKQTLPVLTLSANSEDFLAETLVDLTSAKTSTAIPRLRERGLTAVLVRAIGGDAWIKIADGGATVAPNGANCVFCPQNQPISLAIAAGSQIQAINA